MIYGAIVLLLAALAGGFTAGRAWVQSDWDAAKAAQALEVTRARERADEAAEAYSQAAAHMQGERRVIVQAVDRVVSRPVYRDECLDPDGLRIARAAIDGTDPGGAAPAVPAASAAP